MDLDVQDNAIPRIRDPKKFPKNKDLHIEQSKKACGKMENQGARNFCSRGLYSMCFLIYGSWVKYFLRNKCENVAFHPMAKIFLARKMGQSAANWH